MLQTHREGWHTRRQGSFLLLTPLAAQHRTAIPDILVYTRYTTGQKRGTAVNLTLTLQYKQF